MKRSTYSLERAVQNRILGLLALYMLCCETDRYSSHHDVEIGIMATQRQTVATLFNNNK